MNQCRRGRFRVSDQYRRGSRTPRGGSPAGAQRDPAHHLNRPVKEKSRTGPSASGDPGAGTREQRNRPYGGVGLEHQGRADGEREGGGERAGDEPDRAEDPPDQPVTVNVPSLLWRNVPGCCTPLTPMPPTLVAVHPVPGQVIGMCWKTPVVVAVLPPDRVAVCRPAQHPGRRCPGRHRDQRRARHLVGGQLRAARHPAGRGRPPVPALPAARPAPRPPRWRPRPRPVHCQGHRRRPWRNHHCPAPARRRPGHQRHLSLVTPPRDERKSSLRVDPGRRAGPLVSGAARTFKNPGA